MTRGRRTTRLAALAACLQLLAGIGLDRSLSLCIADDGHAAIEVAHLDERCETETRRHHGTQEAPGLGELDSHGCRDVSLAQPSLRSSTDALSSPVSHVALLLEAGLPRGHAVRRDLPAFGRAPHLRALASIVLLA